jgi:copper transport protein
VKRAAALAVAVAAALAVPAAAWAHAALLKTFPAASAEVDTPPAEVRLVYSEAVEPRFAVVSVTDAAARQEADGRPHRSPANPDELDIPLRRVPRGWYLVFWRVISVDGHPVRGAFTFKVGPNPGPAPQFVIPSLSETAATPRLVTARWIAFLSMMGAIGLFVLRVAIARPVVARVSGIRLRAVSIAFWIALVVALVATPVYVLLATAQFSLRSFWSLGALVPLMRASAFGRAYLDLELALVLFALAAAAALWLDRPDRPQRSVAALLSLVGAFLAAAAVLLVPGAGGHAAQTSPRPVALGLDWLHLASGSLWVGGLAGLLVLWRSLPVAQRVAGLVVCVPRFSNVAFASVLALLATGVGASVLHLPTLASLWQTSYGKAILVKAAVLAAAMLVASVNLLRTKPALQRETAAPGAAVLLRRLVGTEVVLVAGAVLVAAVLSSLAPPPKALAGFGGAAVHTGPGPVTRVVSQNGYRVDLEVTPNRAAVPNDFTVRLSRGGQPVRRAAVTATFTMLDMEMPAQSYALSESAPGLYRRSGVPALVMVGRWGLSFSIEPRGAQPFSVVLVDRANG